MAVRTSLDYLLPYLYKLITDQYRHTYIDRLSCTIQTSCLRLSQPEKLL
jgi:hypothetical protein